MFASLKRKMGITKRNTKSRSDLARRSVRLDLERLETREALSGFGDLTVLSPAAFQAPNAQVQTTSPLTDKASPGLQSIISLNQSIANTIANEVRAINNLVQNFVHIYEGFIYDLTHQVPNLTGVNFTMTSQRNGGSNYTLLIQQQTDHLFGTASFTGLWGGHAQVTGTLSVVPDGSISIQGSWTEGTNTHMLQGTITGMPGSYHIEADVIVNGSSSIGPGHLSGNQH